MNPYPFAPLNHFTVPFSLTKKLLSPLAKNYLPAVVCLPCSVRPGKQNARYRTPPRTDARIFLLASLRAKRTRTNKNGSPAFRRGFTRDELLWSRKKRRRRRDIALLTQKRNLLHIHQPCVVGEAPDNIRNPPVGKCEIQERNYCPHRYVMTQNQIELERSSTNVTAPLSNLTMFV